jgi:inosine/xanthosine triphosphatase
MRTIRVRVGSLNRAKLEAVRLGLAPFFAKVELEGCPAESGVSEQPIGLEEIVAGARARARQSLADAQGNWDLGAGIEDGLIAVPGTRTGYLNVGACVLFDGREESLGLSAGFEYPPACVEAATGPDRTPVGGSFDRLFALAAEGSDPGPGAGNIGRLTGGRLTRAEYGAQAVTCALVRRLHPRLYEAEPGARS